MLYYTDCLLHNSHGGKVPLTGLSCLKKASCAKLVMKQALFSEAASYWGDVHFLKAVGNIGYIYPEPSSIQPN